MDKALLVKLKKAAGAVGASKQGDRFYCNQMLWSVVTEKPLSFGRASDGDAPLGRIEELLDSGLPRDRLLNQLAITMAEVACVEWGPGDSAKFRPIERVLVNDRAVELGFGEHPHSRRDDNFYVRYDERNYLKRSGLSGNEVRKSCACDIYVTLPRGGRGLPKTRSDDSVVGPPVRKLIYSMLSRTAERVLSELPGVLTKLSEFPVQLWNGERTDDFPDLVGRKIYYRNTPAIVTAYHPDDGVVVVEAASGHKFQTPPWRKEDDDFPDFGDGRRVRDDLFSPHIWWFRKKG